MASVVPAVLSTVAERVVAAFAKDSLESFGSRYAVISRMRNVKRLEGLGFVPPGEGALGNLTVVRGLVVSRQIQSRECRRGTSTLISRLEYSSVNIRARALTP